MNIIDYWLLRKEIQHLKNWMNLEDIHEHNVVSMDHNQYGPIYLYRFICAELDLVSSVHDFVMKPEQNLPTPIMSIYKQLQNIERPICLDEIKAIAIAENARYLDRLIISRILETLAWAMKIEKGNKEKYKNRLRDLLSLSFSQRLSFVKDPSA